LLHLISGRTEEKEVILMVKVSIEVRHEAARFTVSVTAPSIRQAQTLVQAHYPASAVEVKIPIDPESFLVEDSAGPNL
jgi:hypothetical protein